MHKNGFTIIEVLVAISILAILSTVSVSNFYLLQKSFDLDTGVQEVMEILKLAQSRTLSSESNSQYGVYFDSAVSPNKYTLFKGATFATRIVASDQNYWLPKTTEFFNISFGASPEVVFDRLSGTSAQSGSISLRLKADVNQNKIIYISNSGLVSFNSETLPSDDDRFKDSRHTHFDYSRVINTASENIILNFNNGALVHTFAIGSYLVSGQLDLTDTVLVSGTQQTIKIKTHRLNETDTQFSIHRDRRINDKSLVITLSGDSTGNLISYSADGTTTTYSSIYVSNFAWQ